jgi:hypothetical protein
VTTTAVIPIGELGSKYRSLAKRLPGAVKKALVGAAMLLVVKVNEEVELTTPHPPHGVTNAYAAGWRWRRRPDGAVVFNMTPESVWIERGRNKGPVSDEGYEALKLWVKRKGLYLDEVAVQVPHARSKHLPGYLEADHAAGTKASQRRELGRFRKRVREDAVEMAIATVATAIRNSISHHGYHARFPLWRAIQAWAPKVRAEIERELLEASR